MTALTADLKASAMCQRIINRVRAAKAKLPVGTYRRLCDELASQIGYEVNDVDFGHLPDGPAYSDDERDNALSVYDS